MWPLQVAKDSEHWAVRASIEQLAAVQSDADILSEWLRAEYGPSFTTLIASTNPQVISCFKSAEFANGHVVSRRTHNVCGPAVRDGSGSIPETYSITFSWFFFMVVNLPHEIKRAHSPQTLNGEFLFHNDLPCLSPDAAQSLRVFDNVSAGSWIGIWRTVCELPCAYLAMIVLVLQLCAALS